jgi:hypothetical protein
MSYPPSRVDVKAAMVIFGLSMVASGAQRPERPQELHLPGLGYVLKTGWQLILEHGCRFAVPETWHATSNRSLIMGLDGSSLSIAKFQFASWSAHKAQVRAAFGHVTVHEDSDRRLWFEIGDKLKIQHYIDVATGVGACAGILDLPQSTALSNEDINRIVEGIGFAPEHWSPGSR